jgi:hypothetical protein
MKNGQLKCYLEAKIKHFSMTFIYLRLIMLSSRESLLCNLKQVMGRYLHYIIVKFRRELKAKLISQKDKE